MLAHINVHSKISSEPVLWQRLLNFGNECFNKENWLQAEYYYKEAESTLDYLWSADTSNINLLMAWICSLHNLAYLFEQQGKSHAELKYLLIPHHRMLNISKSKQASQDLKLIAIKALKLTFTPILLFTQSNPTCDGCKQTMKEFQQNLEESQEVVH